MTLVRKGADNPVQNTSKHATVNVTFCEAWSVPRDAVAHAVAYAVGGGWLVASCGVYVCSCALMADMTMMALVIPTEQVESLLVVLFVLFLVAVAWQAVQKLRRLVSTLAS